MFEKILAKSRYSIINHPLLDKDLLLEDPHGKLARYWHCTAFATKDLSHHSHSKFKSTIKAGGSTAICKMLTGVGDGVDTP